MITGELSIPNFEHLIEYLIKLKNVFDLYGVMATI
jgi:hypothetical protein